MITTIISKGYMGELTGHLNMLLSGLTSVYNTRPKVVSVEYRKVTDIHIQYDLYEQIVTLQHDTALKGKLEYIDKEHREVSRDKAKITQAIFD